MKFLPIVERELRVAARRWSTYWMRAWVAFLVGGVGLGIVFANLDEPPQKAALYLFHSVGGGALLYCLLVGARTTADCISEEKREGTLGLLFLTNLKGYDVVLGKMVANSLSAFYGLLAVIPVTAVALLMGGITGGQVAYVAVVLVNTMFLSVAAGVCASACCRSARQAIGLTLALVLGLTLALPALGVALRMRGVVSLEASQYFALPSPIYAYLAPQSIPVPPLNRPLAWESLGVIHALAWTFLLVASVVVKRAWQDRPAGVKRLRWRERWQQWSYGSETERRTFRRRLLDENAIFWLTARDRLKPAWVWGTLGLIVCGWYWGASKFGRDWFTPPVYVATAFLINALLKNWFASEAVRRISEERRAGSLELLLATPLRVEEIIHGQWLALRRQFAGPVLVVLICEVWMMAAGLQHTYGASERQFWLSCWIAGMAFVVADLVALFWAGLWLGLTSRHPKRAYSDTVGRVLALPWVVFSCFLVYTFFLTLRGQTSVTWKTYLGFWVMAGLAADIGFGAWARASLLTRFREAATWRFQLRAPWWKRWLGKSDPPTEMRWPAE